MLIYRIFLFSSISLAIMSCSLDLPPEDEVSDPDAITSVVTAERSLAAAYTSFAPYNDALTWVARSDDMIPSSYLPREVELKNTYEWVGRELINHSESIWKSLYATIAQCNVLLERLPNVSPLTDAESRQLRLIKQRAIYLKALCYFELLKIFSPAYATTNSEPYGILIKDKFNLTKEQNRLTFSQSVNVIEQLLTISAEQDTNTYYITPEVAQLIRAELALWTQDNVKAIALALPLYEKYKTSITTLPVANIWSANASALRLFALDTRNVSVSPYMKLEYNENIGDYLLVASTISYTTTDVRTDVYTIVAPHNANNRLLGKYRKQVKAREQVQYYTWTRPSELVFLLAEAYLKQGDKNSAFALLNVLLTARNANTLAPAATDTDTLLTLLLSEKQKEFVGEPIRFFDLKRNHRPIVRTTTAGTNYTIEATDPRWTLPIPASEKRYNTAILQNKGWNVGEGVNQS